MEAVREILDAEGTSVQEMEINESYSYNGGDAFNDLSIEKVYDDVLSVGQYHTQRGDLMSDPEVRFDVSDPDDWMPIEYTQHGFPTVYQRDENGLDMHGFLKTWDKNLKSQFPAEEVTGGDE